MMPQMNSEEQPGYGHYEGSPSYTQQQQYGTYDDNFVEALAQRIVQRVPQGSQGKIGVTHRNDTLNAGQRLALAIVSVVMLIPLAGVFMGTVGGFTGFIGFGVACAVIFLINAIFNFSR